MRSCESVLDETDEAVSGRSIDSVLDGAEEEVDARGLSLSIDDDLELLSLSAKIQFLVALELLVTLPLSLSRSGPALLLARTSSSILAVHFSTNPPA